MLSGTKTTLEGGETIHCKLVGDSSLRYFFKKSVNDGNSEDLKNYYFIPGQQEDWNSFILGAKDWAAGHIVSDNGAKHWLFVGTRTLSNGTKEEVALSRPIKCD
jgi:hypothetical protein